MNVSQTVVTGALVALLMAAAPVPVPATGLGAVIEVDRRLGYIVEVDTDGQGLDIDLDADGQIGVAVYDEQSGRLVEASYTIDQLADDDQPVAVASSPPSPGARFVLEFVGTGSATVTGATVTSTTEPSTDNLLALSELDLSGTTSSYFTGSTHRFKSPLPLPDDALVTTSSIVEGRSEAAVATVEMTTCVEAEGVSCDDSAAHVETITAEALQDPYVLTTQTTAIGDQDRQDVVFHGQVSAPVRHQMWFTSHWYLVAQSLAGSTA